MSEGAADWRRQPERGSLLGIRLMRWLAIRLPAGLLDPLVYGLALYFTLFQGQRSRAGSEAYFRRLQGHPARFVDRFRQTLAFAHVALDRARLLGGGAAPFKVAATGHHLIERHMQEGRGGVLLGAHFGSFEMLRAFDRTLPGLTVRYMMYQEHAANITRMLEILNPSVAAQVIPVEDGQAAILAAGDAIAAGHFVAFLGDRMPETSDGGDRGSVTVAFLGAPMPLPRAPYLLAMVARAPLILCFAPRTGARRYEITFSEIYDGAAVPRSERDATCQALAEAYTDALGDQCRRHPYNWFNFFDVWG